MALPPLVDPVRALYRLRRDKDEQYPATGKNPSKAPKDERPRESQAEHPEEPLFSFLASGRESRGAASAPRAASGTLRASYLVYTVLLFHFLW